MRVVIAGGAGYCGRLLNEHFGRAGGEIVVLARRAARLPYGKVLVWEGRTLGDWAAAIDGADVVINLAGRTVNCRYTPDNCAEIYASRLDSTAVIGEAIALAARPPAVWLNAASATIYRHALDRPMEEDTGEIGKGFSVDVCKRWEHELFRADTPFTRRVALRSAMVFDSAPGGVYDAFKMLARRGLAGPVCGGRQFVSWITGEDFCRAVQWLIERADLSGPVNIAAPNPLPNRDFLRALRRSLGVPIGLPSARWMLEIGARVLGTETELLLKSRRVAPARLLSSGFDFKYPDWPDAALLLAKA